MTKRERVQAALSGQAVDRVPVGFWGHDFLREWSPQGLAAATIEAYHKYGWDFIKVNPRATYYAEAWGSRYQPSGNDREQPRLVEPALKSAADLRRLQPLDPHHGPFGEQLQALRLIAGELAGEVPFVQTVFCPLGVIGRLAGGDAAKVRSLMREAPADLHTALAAVAATLGDYAVACLEAGADGIFFATVEWASRDTATEDEYREYGRPYDLQVLARVQDAPFNILHVCRDHNMLDLLLDYPVHAFQWAANRPTNATLRDGLTKTGKAVLGGISQDSTLVQGTPQQVAAEMQAALAQTGGRRFLLGPGCSVSPQTPEANLRAVLGALTSQP
ncbi:MAG: uroporphyrinogen decarboxylase family protein [Dehalococcoidia bacterium]